MKTKRKKPTIKEVALNLSVCEGALNQLKIRAFTQAKLFNELITFLGKEEDFKEHLKAVYIPEKMKKDQDAKQEQDTQKSK